MAHRAITTTPDPAADHPRAVEPVDLDAVARQDGYVPPRVVEGRVIGKELVRWRIEDSPLFGQPHRLHGHVVTDPHLLGQMAVDFAWYRLPWYRRWFSRKPRYAGTPAPRHAVTSGGGS